MRLTGKQKNFAKNIVSGMNYTQAAINAGYSEKTAYSTGSENMRKPQILDYIDELQKEREELLRRRFMNEANLAFSEMLRVLYNEDTPPHVKKDTAKIIIDYAGFKPIEKQEVEMTADVDIGKQSEMLEKYLKDVDANA